LGAAASAPSQIKLTCPAKARSGGRCKLSAGHGTDHAGYGLCKFHGGTTPNGRKSAAKLQAVALGAELDLDPHEALLLTVRKAAMWERFCAGQVATLTGDDLVVVRSRTVERITGEGGSSETVTESRSELNLWLREHIGAVRELAHLAKVAIDAGVEERRVRLAEQLVDDLAAAFDLFATRLGVRDHPEAPAALRAALQLVEAPRALTAGVAA
jgi:hypothetical protein